MLKQYRGNPHWYTKVSTLLFVIKTAPWQITYRDFCPLGWWGKSLQLENISVCGPEPHAGRWQHVMGNVWCLASVHWLKSKHPPDIWNSQQMASGFDYTVTKCPESSSLTSHRRPLLRAVRPFIVFYLPESGFVEMWFVRGTHGGDRGADDYVCGVGEKITFNYKNTGTGAGRRTQMYS